MKYHIQPMKMEQIDTSYPVNEDGTDRVFRNVGIQQSDAGEIPKRIHTRFKHGESLKTRITTLCFVISQERADLIYKGAEACRHAHYPNVYDD